MDLELSMDINLIPCWLLIQSQLPGAEEWSILTFVNLTSNLVAMTSIDAVWATYILFWNNLIRLPRWFRWKNMLKSSCCQVEHLKSGDHKVACCLIKCNLVWSSLIKCTHDVSALYGEVKQINSFTFSRQSQAIYHRQEIWSSNHLQDSKTSSGPKPAFVCW